MANTTGLGDTIYAAVKKAFGDEEGYDDLKKPYGLGDTIYTAVKKAINDAGNGGGGGSSDFTTAEVTIVNSREVSLEGTMATTFDGEISGAISSLYVDVNETVTLPAILYKGHSAAIFNNHPGPVTINGSATDRGDGFIDVTGDCTITVS